MSNGGDNGRFSLSERLRKNCVELKSFVQEFEIVVSGRTKVHRLLESGLAEKLN